MKKFNISWWSGNYENEGCILPPFDFSVVYHKPRFHHGLSFEQFETLKHISNDFEYWQFVDKYGKEDKAFIAEIISNNESDVWELVKKYFPDYTKRYCEEIIE